MKKLVIGVLTKSMLETEIKHGQKVIKTENDLLALNTKALMKLYNSVMKKFRYYIDEHNQDGQTFIDDDCREYMLDKLYEIYENVGVLYDPTIEDELYMGDYISKYNDARIAQIFLYDPTIEDELYMGDYISKYNDARIAQIYNHNMFDHDFIN